MVLAYCWSDNTSYLYSKYWMDNESLLYRPKSEHTYTTYNKKNSYTKYFNKNRETNE